MRVLILGNSQASALRGASSQGKFTARTSIDFSFYVVPGGQGPNFTVKGDRFSVTAFDERYPPQCAPEGVPDTSLQDYDAVVVSALGYIDGGFLYGNVIPRQGLLAEFGPRPNEDVSALISVACLRETMIEGFRRHAGFQLLEELGAAYSGDIIVQPFPYVSACLQEREDWAMRRFYDDYIGAHLCLGELRTGVLQGICERNGARLLPPPEAAVTDQMFTRKELMNTHDGLHGSAEYGAMVLHQIEDELHP